MSDEEIVLITGGNSGLGLEIARKLVRDHGERFHVLIGSRTPVNGEKVADKIRLEGHVNVEAVHIDVTDKASLAAAAKTVLEKFGRLDVLHVNAGVAPDLADSASEQSLSDLIMTATATNAAGSAATVEHFEHLLQKADNPRVVFMSTPMGSTEFAAKQLRSMPMPMPAYSASKAAMNMVALHYCKKHPQWKVNACTPGYRATKLVNVDGKPPPGQQPGRIQEGAVNAVRLTLLDKDGETGTHTELEGVDGFKSVPW